MKLPISRKQFEEIKDGAKNIEFRDAHITFVAEDDGEELRKEINTVMIGSQDSFNHFSAYRDLTDAEKEKFFTNKRIMGFMLE